MIFYLVSCFLCQTNKRHKTVSSTSILAQTSTWKINEMLQSEVSCTNLFHDSKDANPNILVLESQKNKAVLQEMIILIKQNWAVTSKAFAPFLQDVSEILSEKGYLLPLLWLQQARNTKAGLKRSCFRVSRGKAYLVLLFSWCIALLRIITYNVRQYVNQLKTNGVITQNDAFIMSVNIGNNPPFLPNVKMQFRRFRVKMLQLPCGNAALVKTHQTELLGTKFTLSPYVP